MYRHIAKIEKNDHLGSNNDQCYIQNHAVLEHVIKRSRAQLFKINDIVHK